MAGILGRTYARLFRDRHKVLKAAGKNKKADKDPADMEPTEELRILERHLEIVALRAKLARTAGLDFQWRYDSSCASEYQRSILSVF